MINKNWRTKNMEQQKLCKRLVYKSFTNSQKPNVILGIVLEETEEYIKFKTAKNEILVSKSLVLSLENTNQVFMGGVA